MYFSLGRCSFELAQRLSRVALASHMARRGTPFGVTVRGNGSKSRMGYSSVPALRRGWEGDEGVQGYGPRRQGRWGLVGAACSRSKRNIISFRYVRGASKRGQHGSSQRSLQDAPVFRLLLKVAVKGTHQCDFFNFWGSLGLPTMLPQ